MKDEKRAKALRVARALEETFPQPRVELDYTNALELLVATVLAAQCTDVKVNQVTRDLFANIAAQKTMSALR